MSRVTLQSDRGEVRCAQEAPVRARGDRPLVFSLLPRCQGLCASQRCGQSGESAGESGSNLLGGTSVASYYLWMSRVGGVSVPVAKRLKTLLAESLQENQVPREVLRRWR